VNEIPLAVLDVGHSDKSVAFSFPPEFGVLKARVVELLPFVEHIAGATCHCQQDRLQAEQNYHMPSCMVGQARKALAGRKEGA
jgi:hypothetical protein